MKLVVYHLFPTSNHNSRKGRNDTSWLYIIFFLHQTTTLPSMSTTRLRCISSFSYIKPQPRRSGSPYCSVVYHLFPTSNHNPFQIKYYLCMLYIIFFLHQTTTRYSQDIQNLWLYIILSYINLLISPKSFISKSTPLTRALI